MSQDRHPTEDLPAYALGALDKDEREVIASHVETCATCASTVAEFEEALYEVAAIGATGAGAQGAGPPDAKRSAKRPLTRRLICGRGSCCAIAAQACRARPAGAIASSNFSAARFPPRFQSRSRSCLSWRLASSGPVDSRPTPTRAHLPASRTVEWSRSRQQAQIRTRALRSSYPVRGRHT